MSQTKLLCERLFAAYCKESAAQRKDVVGSGGRGGGEACPANLMLITSNRFEFFILCHIEVLSTDIKVYLTFLCVNYFYDQLHFLHFNIGNAM